MFTRPISQYQPPPAARPPVPPPVIGGETPATPVATPLVTPQVSINTAARDYVNPTGVKLPTPPPKSVGRTVTRPPVTSSLTPFSDRLAEEIQESPLGSVHTLAEEPATISFKNAVILGVGLFFLGIAVAVIVMLLIY